MVPPYGGLIPPGIPGHTPGLGLPYDPDLARRLLAEAGYPNGNGFPMIKGKNPFVIGTEEFNRQMREVLGIDVDLEPSDWKSVEEEELFLFGGWIADYPDPDSFLRKAYFHNILKDHVWEDEAYETLVNQAARTIDRKQRMAMCREADRLLVEKHALIAPLGHFLIESAVIHPRVRQYPLSAMNFVNLQEVVVEPD
jgi:ABC-type transport system substrate-binding protein